ncbi:MAG: nuclear transport factor 2 family protein [Solirubrobacterales bacterium]
MSEKDTPQALQETISRYNEAWNAHDLDAIMSMHAADIVFENHTAGEAATGEEARAHIGAIFETWPDINFTTRRQYVRDGLVVQEWPRPRHTQTRCAAATSKPSRPGTP